MRILLACLVSLAFVFGALLYFFPEILGELADRWLKSPEPRPRRH